MPPEYRRGVGLARAVLTVAAACTASARALRARRAIQPGRGGAEGPDPRVQGDVRPYVQSARLEGKLRSRASRGSATRTCARVPAD